MKNISTILFSLTIILSLYAKAQAPDSSQAQEFKITSCKDYTNKETKNIKSDNNPSKKLKALAPIKWMERVKMLDYVEERYFLNGKATVQFIGDTKINQNDLINYNVLIFDGTLTVNSNFTGLIAAVNSNVVINSKSGYNNNIVLFNSSVSADSNFSSNNIVCGEYPDYNYVSIPFKTSFGYHSPQFRYFKENFNGNGVLRYNRVEGLFFGLSSDKRYYWNGQKDNSFYGSFGYGFGNHRWTGALGYDRWTGNSDRIEFGGEIHSVTDSKDNWRVGNTENSLASFFIHEDYKDYFLKEGWSLHLSKYFNKYTILDARYVQDNYRNQSRNADWALFGGDKIFRENPPVTEGILRSAIFTASYSTITDKQYLPDGWDATANFEIANGSAKYNRILLDVRKYIALDDYNHISLRVMAGSSDNPLPQQKSFEIGGIGSIPAARYKTLYGNRMLLANIEYSIPLINIFEDFFDSNHLSGHSHTNFIVSYDAGYASESQASDITKGFDINKQTTRQDLGISLGFNRNTFRVGAAFRLDKSESAQFIFRISRPF